MTRKYADESARWQAVLDRDSGANGQFFYGVTSTGIFCRPICPSRRPRRDRVVFFQTIEKARAAGYRPCARCRPEQAGTDHQHSEAIAIACKRLADADRVPSLAELASTARLSPFHFHRLFKRAVGVTPRQYRNGLLVERAKDALRKGQSVTSALYDAGFSSSGRFYESSGRQLGMTPRQYQKGALDVRFSVRRCSLGWLLVAATARGVCEVWLGDDRDRLQRRLSVLFPHSVPVRRDRPFSKWLDLVMRAVDKPENAPGLPLDLRGTAFQMQVWNAIREIPIGTSRTYAQLARKIGNPKTVRAVANACASNPTAIVVPCHRVMRTDGGLGGYRWGLKRKKVLLGREKAIPE